MGGHWDGGRRNNGALKPEIECGGGSVEHHRLVPRRSEAPACTPAEGIRSLKQPGDITSREPVFQFSRISGSHSGAGGVAMNVMHPRCAALDLGKDVLVAAVRVQEETRVERDCRTYGTTSHQLLELSSWLSSHRVTQVAMEATGSYWKSVWHVLEGQFELVLAHPASIRNLPGRKSDVNDATWMADLLAHGLVRGSFVPPAEISALRELTRTRKQFVREVARHTQRIQKILHVGNLKITGLITDVLGARCPSDPDPQGLRVDEGLSDSNRLGGRLDQQQLSPGPVSPTSRSPGSQEGHRRGGRLDPDHRLPRDTGRYRL